MPLSISHIVSVADVCCKRNVAPNLLDFANQNRMAGLFTDVTICAEKQQFLANKIVLSCYSTYFKTMFTTEMRERYESSVEIENIDAETMKSIIEYIYTGNLIINKDNVCDLLSAADYLQIDDAKQFCFEFLKSAITVDSCFILLAIADLYRNDSLKNDVKQFVSKNFDKIVCGDDFKTISKDQLITCISNQDRSHAQESTIYDAVMEWIKHDENNRGNDVFELLQLVDLEELPSIFLEDVVSNEDLVANDISCLRLVNKAITNQSKQTRYKESGTRILSAGGLNQSVSKSVIELFKLFRKHSSIFPDLPSNRNGGVCLRRNDTIYYIGGSTSAKLEDATNIVYKMNTKDKDLKWEEIAPMFEKRDSVGAAVFNDTLVAAGGYNGSDSLSSVECYSPIFNKWQSISPMKKCRSCHVLVTCKDRLYAIGGAHGSEFLSSVERLSSGDGEWEDVKSMQTARKWFGAVKFNDVIYGIGGQAGKDGDKALKSAEKYDVVKDEWEYISEMNFGRNSCSACVLQGKIYVVGGLDANNQSVMEIECYDPMNDKWTVLGKTDKSLFYHSLVVI